MGSTTRVEIKKVFSEITKQALDKPDDQPLLEQLYEIAVRLGIQAVELGNKWESFVLNRNLPIKFTVQGLNTFKQELNENYKPLVVKKEKDRAVQDKSSLPSALIDLSSIISEYAGEMGEKGEDNAQIFNEQRQRQREEAAAEEDRKRKIALEQSRVPKFKREEPAAASSPVKPSSQPYLARKNKGVIKTVHNEALPKTLAAPTKVTVEEISVVKYKRCVNNKFELMTEYLEGRLSRLGRAALADHKRTEVGLLERPSQETIVSYGRICSEVDENVNLASLILEGEAHGLKPRVPLDLAELEACSVFPGEIAAVEGINDGKRFIASQILPPLPLPHRAPPVEGVSLLVAAGPFTSTSAIAYEPFADLLEIIRSTKPSAVILMGPFVDADHPDIKAPAGLGDSFEGVFETHCLKKLEDLNIEVFLLPSVRDVHHMFPFPQPPFDVKADKRIHLVSNPAVFSVNGLLIGATSTDVVLLMTRYEMSKNALSVTPSPAPAASNDRMTHICEHILQQRSFFPIHPPGLVCADVSLLGGAELTEHSPDLLILPSVCEPFVKVACNTLCLNPGKLTKFNTGGTYASVVVHPKEDSSASGNSLLERVRVEVVHI